MNKVKEWFGRLDAKKRKRAMILGGFAVFVICLAVYEVVKSF